jgi:hypothetical protein
MHAYLMSGVHERIGLVRVVGLQLLRLEPIRRDVRRPDEPEPARIDWGDDDGADSSSTANRS